MTPAGHLRDIDRDIPVNNQVRRRIDDLSATNTRGKDTEENQCEQNNHTLSAGSANAQFSTGGQHFCKYVRFRLLKVCAQLVDCLLCCWKTIERINMHKVTTEDISLAANTIRGLSMDAIQAANSGHPGLPMGMADVAAVLWLKHLKHSPAAPDWADRDRFVLSGGHGSMLLYSLLHLAGYGLALDELKKFRQIDSLTPGHPEWKHTVGVETTTGPLGQGIANAVGMALAEKMMAERFNDDESSLVDHMTYVFCGDGDLMEGISHEACSLAGHLKLEKLVMFYDSNSITIEGSTDLACSDDVKKRFQSYGWRTLEVDAHDIEAIDRAIKRASRLNGQPTIVICTSLIGKGSPNKEGKACAHGEPLGTDEIALTKKALGMPAEDFHVPEWVTTLFEERKAKMKRLSNKWLRTFETAAASNPEKAQRWNTFMSDELPAGLEAALPEFEAGSALASRAASGKVIQALTAVMPQLVGGSADLSPSTKTLINDADSILPEAFAGKNLHFGIREHAMASMMNGMSVHGGFRVFGATFFVFVDYCRPAVRLAAIMNLPVIYVFAHDSFYVGEDGPTHEPVEQIASLRCMPGMTVIRPADPTETGAAWVAALKNKNGPTALLLTRQNLPVIDRSVFPAANSVERGAYTLKQNGEGTPEVILLATGSEVQLAIDAAEALKDVNIRVVSMPSWELFEAQDQAYRDSVIDPACCKRVAIEAGTSFGWERYIGRCGKAVTLDHYGSSGPYKILAEKFGFTVENVVAVTKSLLG